MNLRFFSALFRDLIKKNIFLNEFVGLIPYLSNIFIYLVIAFLLFTCVPGETGVPKAEKGILDLRDWSFERDGNLNLDGEWEFYWKSSDNPTEIEVFPKVKDYIHVPSSWNGHLIRNYYSNKDFIEEKLNGEGYATYKILVLLKEGAEKDLAIRMADQGTVVKVYINKLLYYDNEYISGNINKFSRYIDYSSITNSSQELVIEVIVKNYYHYYGGFYTSLILGNKKNIFSQKNLNLSRDMVIIGIVLIMSIYHSGLYVLRKEDKSTLYFSIFCFILLIRFLITGERTINIIYKNFDYNISFKLEHTTIYIGITVFFEFIYILFTSSKLKIARNIIGLLCFSFSMIVLGTNPLFFVPLLTYMEIIIFISVILILYFLTHALKSNRADATILLVGFSIFGAVIINDLLYSRKFIDTGFYSPIGFIFFIFSQSFMLSARFSRAFSDAKEAREIADRQSSLLQNSYEEIERLSRAKDEFLANLSHEFKTPLSTIYGYSQLLSMNDSISNNERNYGIEIYKSVEKLNSYMDDVLLVTDLESNLVFQRRKFQLKGILNESIQSLSSLLEEKQIKLVVSFPEELEVYGDSILLKRVIFNVIKNAIVYNVREGIVFVDCNKEDNSVLLCVSDQGIGISPEFHAKVFEKFFRVDSSLSYEVSGVGLGLFLTKRILELHEGSIEVKSNLGEGSKFFIRLPYPKE